ncbi:YifB family Mg chelatase-like AAA ATPase [Phytomonospora endophytica]|uniref:Magnesium chelatase family protein n=1 Tax=Phytomonospora endophytica TaxID=714109 RepID=A0A841F6E7_9ACTN|nr:YifB family Mg chelatase-like AAA ATPase [Phytomonospora endophytica]MBB6032501.1 magnesium chelatase family protein [Phytomonospora endophytica]GIG66351.1 hypothetical protein Pen01_26460 [Phytomonospora endophytica]
MGYARITAVGLVGVTGHLVTVEAHVDRGQARVVLSGLPDAVLGQARDRVRSALVNSGFHWPDQRIAINLLPASLPKHGSSFDLAIALVLLVASGQLPPPLIDGIVPIGELGLDGRLRPVPGVLPALMAARESRLRAAVVAPGNLREAALVSGLTVHGSPDLRRLTAGLAGQGEMLPVPELDAESEDHSPDLADVVGQDAAKRALEISAAGGHNLMLLGPPGVGKTMLAERLPPLLPRLDDASAMEVTAIHSIAGQFEKRAALLRRAPFQAPHHSASMPALVGGGSGVPRPGALSLAHCGVLFLDELPEFRRDVIDALRQPLESGIINIHRSAAVVRFPARVLLMLAANPCPCAAPKPADCECSAMARGRYRAKLKGPLMDRVDLHVRLQPVGRSALLGDEPAPEDSRAVAERVSRAREAAAARWESAGCGRIPNSQVAGARLRARPWRLPSTVLGVADWMLDSGRLSARGYDRVQRLAWSIADLAGRDRPDENDLGEAVELRLGHKV